MKLLKTLTKLFIILFLGANIGLAQAQPNELTEAQKEELDPNMKKFVEVLNLTDEQKPAFEAITKKYAAQMMAVKDGSSGKLQKYRKVKAIRKDKDSEMKKLLTEDQFDIYLEKQEEMQERMREKWTSY